MKRRKLTKEEKKIFKKYGLMYSLETKQNDEDRIKVARQKYLYKKLKEKGLKNTAIEKFLDLTVAEIDVQYKRKEHLESRGGFLLALYGILVGIFAQSNTFCTMKEILIESVTPNLKIIILTFLTIAVFALGIFVIKHLQQVFNIDKYKRPEFEEREYNFKQTVDDKEITYVVLLELYTNIWEANEKIMQKKENCFKHALVFMVFFTLAVILC